MRRILFLLLLLMAIIACGDRGNPLADQAKPRETVQVAAGITVTGMFSSFLDTDKDGVNYTLDH